MKRETRLLKGLRTPRAAAIAGILFALLLGTSIVVTRLSIDADPADAAKWLVEGGNRTAVSLAANLIPFAGIAFLWFLAVIRDQMGEREDRFFATVFLGSGLLFVAMLFASAAVTIGMLETFEAMPAKGVASQLWGLGGQTTMAFLNVFALRMAAVFMMTVSTIALRTSLLKRWLAFLGFPISLVLLIASGSLAYVNLLFPLWILLVSLVLLLRSLRAKGELPVPEGKG